MSKSRSAVADYAVYLLLRVFLCVIQMMTLPAALSNITITPSSLSEATPAMIRINWMVR